MALLARASGVAAADRSRAVHDRVLKIGTRPQPDGAWQRRGAFFLQSGERLALCWQPWTANALHRWLCQATTWMQK